ncbi:MAG: hypothetical protein M1832_004795 [Thelocarpon impressellum]|nr:MAG: hypothetical protein M1832_004795 [Thelocarpon impressellum]
MDPPAKLDGPSMQLYLDMRRLDLSAGEEFSARLDRDFRDREAAHRAALDQAAAEHERVRQSAEVARQRFEHEVQKEIKRRQDEEARELDKIRQEKAERELAERRRDIEHARREEATRMMAEEEEANARAAAAAAETRRRDEKDRAEAVEGRLRAQRAEAEAEAETRQRAAAVAGLASQTPAQASSPLPAQQADQRPVDHSAGHASQAGSGTTPAVKGTWGDRDGEHQEYRQIHQRLKQLRTFMVQGAKQNPDLKRHMGDMRREIRKRVGQCTEGRGANKGLMDKVMAILGEAKADANSPKVDVRQFLSARTLASIDSANATDAAHVPGLLVYLVNIFTKAIIAQFISEASVSPKAADPVGIIAVQMFAAREFRWNGASLIDILLAKFHVVCPVLWGMYGDEGTVQGKARLGWWREERDGPWVSEQRHGERMTGLGAGFASLALRDFSKTKLVNPLPNAAYWRALHAIVALPPGAATATHFTVLKAMVEGHEARFLKCYGSAALAGLRKALIDFPRHAGGQGGASVAARAVAVLPDVLKRNHKLTL